MTVIEARVSKFHWLTEWNMMYWVSSVETLHKAFKRNSTHRSMFPVKIYQPNNTSLALEVHHKLSILGPILAQSVTRCNMRASTNTQHCWHDNKQSDMSDLCLLWRNSHVLSFMQINPLIPHISSIPLLSFFPSRSTCPHKPLMFLPVIK